LKGVKRMREKVLYREVSKSLRVKPQDCANFTKEFNGEKDWCLIRDTKCPMIHGIEFPYHTIPPERLYLCPVLQELNLDKKGQLGIAKGKDCQKCGKPFLGSRSHFCEFCRYENKRDQARQRKRKERAMSHI
jgi:hypothetical protein